MEQFQQIDDILKEQSDHSGSFMYWSVPYYWIREERLSRKSTSWPVVEATVELTHRTKGGYKQTIRAELFYRYSFGGKNYAGHIVRECCFAISSANQLVDEHKVGQNIQIRVNPKNPEESYCPSGFGSVEPFFTLILSSVSTLILAGIIMGVLIIPFFRHLLNLK